MVLQILLFFCIYICVICWFLEGLMEYWFHQMSNPRKIKNLLTYLLTYSRILALNSEVTQAGLCHICSGLCVVTSRTSFNEEHVKALSVVESPTPQGRFPFLQRHSFIYNIIPAPCTFIFYILIGWKTLYFNKSMRKKLQFLTLKWWNVMLCF